MLRAGLTPRNDHFLIYTSGTTGLPKAAHFSHFRFLMAMSFGLLSRFTSADRIYCTLPLYHSAGGVIGVSTTMFLGASLVLRRKFSASNFWKVGLRSTVCVGGCVRVRARGCICMYICVDAL